MSTKPSSDIAMIGLSVMGAALARNMESRGYTVSVYNRSKEKTTAFMKQFGDGKFVQANSLRALVDSLKRPRKLMIMVKAGPAVDAVITELLPHLQKGDLIIDGGNTHYRDTQRREAALKKKGIHFIGTGVSGGEEGALYGPSIMPGGSKAAWKKVKPILEAIAAKDFSGGPCVAHIGENGAGHYVKMAHNGIEYGIMQLIAETYSLFRKGYGMNATQIADIFASYTRGKLNSYLFDIAVPVLRQKDEKKKGDCALIYHILDKASQKGTGKWASVDALDRGVAVPTITQAVYARYISGEKNVRKKLHKKYPQPHRMSGLSRVQAVHLIRDALYAAIISTYAQGYHLMQEAAEEEGWKLDYAEISRIWEGGCIIRAKLLKTFHTAYNRKSAQGKHLFLLPSVEKLLKKDVKKLRKLVGTATASGIPLAGFGSSLFYFEAMAEDRLPANMIQGLRDYFGAHTYERIDAPGSFHTHWG